MSSSMSLRSCLSNLGAGGSRPRGKSSKKGKKSSGSNRGLVIGLVAGGGMLVAVLIAWLLWPSKPDVVAEAPAANAVGTPATAGAGGTPTPPAAVPETPPSDMSSHVGSPSTEVATTPTVTNPAPGTELVGDLQTLQGTWQVSDVAVPPEIPKDRTAAMITQMKQGAWTIKDSVLTISYPMISTLFTIKLDPTQAPKTIDLIPVDRKIPLKVGLYSIEGETWQLCMTENSKVRPPAMKADQAMLLTFQRGNAAHAALDSQFDIKAWQAAEVRLKAMKVRADMDSNIGGPDYAEGITHVVGISPPETADGTLSPELWTITKSLSHVMIRTVSTTDATLQQLSQHPGLVGLNLSGRFRITPAGIAYLKSCSHLRGLYFSEVPVSAELLTAVSQLSQLRSFGIYKSPVSSEMLGSIVQLNQLESLSLQETGTTDADVVQIVKLTKLKTLFLSNTKVTDTGLNTLKSLKDLTMFSVQGLTVTPQAVADFEAALPKCQVQK